MKLQREAHFGVLFDLHFRPSPEEPRRQSFEVGEVLGQFEIAPLKGHLDPVAIERSADTHRSHRQGAQRFQPHRARRAEQVLEERREARRRDVGLLALRELAFRVRDLELKLAQRRDLGVFLGAALPLEDRLDLGAHRIELALAAVRLVDQALLLDQDRLDHQHIGEHDQREADGREEHRALA
jgi:hypothetical protein